MNTKDHTSKFRCVKFITIVGMTFCGFSIAAQAAGAAQQAVDLSGTCVSFQPNLDHS